MFISHVGISGIMINFVQESGQEEEEARGKA